MSATRSSSIARRGFLARLSAATAGLSAVLADAGRADASSSGTSSSGPDPDAWIANLKGREKVMIHVHQHFTTALADARTMLANARELYAVPEGQFSVAVMTHGPAIQGLLRDELWERRGLGAFYKLNDPKTGAPATRNIYLTPLDNEPADATVPELMKRGVTFVACNVALRNLSKRLANGSDTADSIHAELAAGLVPGVFVAPDLFVSIQRAQKRGVGYIFTDRSR